MVTYAAEELACATSGTRSATPVWKPDVNKSWTENRLDCDYSKRNIFLIFCDTVNHNSDRKSVEVMIFNSLTQYKSFMLFKEM